MSDQALVSQPDTAQEVLRGLRAAVPVMTGFVPVGLILGATGAHTGLSPFTSGLMCAANYAGGSEFAAVALWSTIPPVLMIMVTTWLINSRHIMLSASLTLYMGKLTTRESLFVLFFMCDEAWALAMQDVTRMKRLGKSNDDAFSLPFYVGCAIALWTSWWGSAAVGAWIGNDLGDLEVWGFAMAFPAIFIAILSGMWPGAKKCLPWIVSFVAAGLMSLMFSTPVAVAAGSLLGLAAVWFTTGRDHVEGHKAGEEKEGVK